ncbi:hypothetical protein PHMEG_00039273, partial [Phytophthora megakarya]
ALTQSLIGLEVTYPCVNHFHFDEYGKIVWYAPEVDFVGALMKSLKSPELVTRVMGDALIDKAHMIGDETDGRQLADVEEVNVVKIDSSEHQRFSLSEEMDAMPDRWTSEKHSYEDDQDDPVAVVSDDEPYPESWHERPNRLDIDYILC